MAGAYRYERNDDVLRDLRIRQVIDAIRKIAETHENRLHRHVNDTVIHLLDNSQDPRTLKRYKPSVPPSRC